MKSLNIVFLSLALALPAAADEGMWLFNQPPRQSSATATNSTPPTPGSTISKNPPSASIPAARAASSAPTVSRFPITTSARTPCKNSAPAKRIISRPAFTPARPPQEIKCLDLELNVLQSIEDVTARVNAAVPDDADPAAAFAGPPQSHRGRLKRNPRPDRPALATWSHFGRAARIISTATNATRTCGWSSRRSSRSPSSAATPTTSSFRATTSTSAFSAPTKTASPRRSRTT